jgi:hypothetical protein
MDLGFLVSQEFMTLFSLQVDIQFRGISVDDEGK